MAAPKNVGITADVEMSPRLRDAVRVLSLPPIAAAFDDINAIMISGGHCIRSSLIVRDYLNAVGFTANVLPVGVMMAAWQGDRVLHSLGIGVRGQPAAGPGWNGHLVVTVQDRDRLLIDPSIGAARRDAWADLPAMMITPIVAGGDRHKMNGAMAMLTLDRGDYRMIVQWFAEIRNKGWRGSPETEPDRRREMVELLCDLHRAITRHRD